MGIFDFIFKKEKPIKQGETNKKYINCNKGFSGTGKIYLNVPYSEKEQVKELGARWDPDIKKWYYKGLVRDYIKFAKWISDDEEITIAFEHIYIVERVRTCYKCGKQTRVIGLALGEHLVVYRDDDGTYKCDCFEDVYEFPSLYVTWELCERDIPPVLLEYLKSKYNVHVGKSRIGGTYFANHCEHCDAIQGSNYLMEENIELFNQTDKDIEELKKYTIYDIGIDEDIVLNWGGVYAGCEYVYWKYGQVKELKLPQSKYEDVITYKELYNL